MHLGLICNEYPPSQHGGIGSVCQDLAEGMVGAGHRVTVMGVYAPRFLGGRKPKREIQNGVVVFRLPTWTDRLPHRLQFWLNRWRQRRCLVSNHRYDPFDIVETSDFEGWLPFGGVPGVPLVARLHGSNFYFDAEVGRAGNALETGMEKRGLRHADTWAGVSRYVLEKTREYCGFHPRRGTVLYNAVDTEFFSPGDTPVETGLIVFVNTINARKGAEQLVDAANLVFGSRPASRLMMIGGGSESYLAQLRERVRPEHRARVEFARRLPRNEVLPWLRKAAVCCYPSHSETFGLSPVEAMSAGRPTVYSRIGPGPEVVEDGVSGLLCNPCDPADIAAKINLILDRPALGQNLGVAARKRVLELFDRRQWVRRQVEFYASCVGAKP